MLQGKPPNHAESFAREMEKGGSPVEDVVGQEQKVEEATFRALDCWNKPDQCARIHKDINTYINRFTNSDLQIFKGMEHKVQAIEGSWFYPTGADTSAAWRLYLNADGIKKAWVLDRVEIDPS